MNHYVATPLILRGRQPLSVTRVNRDMSALKAKPTERWEHKREKADAMDDWETVVDARVERSPWVAVYLEHDSAPRLSKSIPHQMQLF